jgi:predicted ATPase
LVGREWEVAAVVARLRSPEVRLLTLTGTGGIGKTRLAIRVAEEIADSVPDGAFFVSLAPVAEPDLVASSMAQALGIHAAGARLPATIREFLRQKHALLVLDNFEHLPEAVPLIPDLLSESPGLKVLVTSREVLRVSGEHAWPVPPLKLPARMPPASLEDVTQFEAVQLFMERAQAAQPDFVASNPDLGAVAKICHRLDGLPLAIELAAACMRHLTPGALLTRLERRLSVLTGGPRDVPRHQTLRGAIAWSYDLLPAAEQALFRRLAVFAGGCTLEGAARVGTLDLAPAETAVLSNIASLVDKSLLRYTVGASGEPRYTMLETVREYGLELLTGADEERVTRERLAHYYEDLAQRAALHFLHAEQLIWLRRMDDEIDNLRGVLAWLLDLHLYERGQTLAGSLWFYWSMHNRLTEGREWLTRVLTVPDGLTTSEQARGRAWLALGLAAARQYDVEACSEAICTSLALSRSAGDTWTMAFAEVRAAWIASQLVDWSRSPSRAGAASPEHAQLQQTAQFEGALAIFRQLGDEWGTAYCLAEFAQFLEFIDDPRARQMADDAFEVASALGDRYTLATSLRHLAYSVADRVEARRLVERALALSSELDDVFGEGAHLYLLAQLQIDAGQFVEALVLLERRATNRRLIGGRAAIAAALHDVAILARIVARTDRAVATCEESLSLCQDLGLKDQVAALQASFGHIHIQQTEFDEAAATLAASLRALASLNVEFGIATALAGVGLLAVDSGRLAEAACLVGATDALLDRLHAGPGVCAVDWHQWGPRGMQFRRDSLHVRELRAAADLACADLGQEAFAVARDGGRALSTAEAVEFGLQLAHSVSSNSQL